jgi:hypothetical protein
MQPSDAAQADNECGKNMSGNTDTPRRTDGVMIIEETLIVPRTVGELDDTVLPKPEVHNHDAGKDRDPIPFDSISHTLLPTSRVSNAAAGPKKDP